MERNALEELIREAVGDTDLHSRDIPAIDLYMDQILSLVAESRRQESPRYHDRELTKTMINNYSKDGLIKPVKGKKYTKEHILQMLLIYSLKSTLSIGEIKRVLGGAYATEGFDGEALAEVYDRFVDMKCTLRERSMRDGEELLAELGLDLANERDFMLFVLSLATMSQYLKKTAETLLESHYPEPRSEKEEKAAEKAEKAEKKEKKPERAKSEEESE